MEFNLAKIKKVHFVGIGGIGISAIARMMMLRGKEVIGSDHASSHITELLTKLGAKISYNHDAENLDAKTDLVVYTIAITPDNPEFKKAKRLKIKTLSYPEMLGIISAEKYTIAISGTHGKTTTTAMIGKILLDAKLDPTVIVGSLMKGFESNLIVGKGKYFVVEACEYRKSFLNLSPKIIVITNIDNDHLDFYKDLKEIEKAFGEFAGKLGEKDFLVCDPNDVRIQEAILGAKCQIVDYTKCKSAEGLGLKVIGEHNVKNAKCALCVAEILKITPARAKKSLANFSGTWRRMEFKGQTAKGAQVYDDYAHHPTEIKATLKGAREHFKNKRIVVAFQPHLYSRTKTLLPDFAKSFTDADLTVVTDIYAAREPDDKSVHSKDLVVEINKNASKATYIGNLAEMKKYMTASDFGRNDIVITMGAGDISEVSDELVVGEICKENEQE